MISNDYIYTSEGLIPTNSLTHYGVLGTKWGHRKAQYYKTKASKAKKAGATEKAKKYESKSKKLTNKHTKLAGGKKTYNRVTSQKTGKLFVKSMLYGTYGTLKYEQARTRGESKGKSFVNGMLYGTLNNATSGLASIIEPRMH